MCILWFKTTWQLENNTPKCYKAQIIWFNSNVKINTKWVYYQKSIRAGIKHIDNILDNDNNLLSYNDCKNKFPNAITWLEYYGICQAIPANWKNVMKRDNKEMQNTSIYCKIDKTSKKAATVYNIIIEGCFRPLEIMYTRVRKHLDIDMEDYCKAFANIKCYTKISKYRDFQYRLLVNAIHANNRLYYWKIVDTKKCEYCLNETQDIKHLLYSCSQMILWKELCKYVKEHTKIELSECTFSWKTIFINLVHPQKFRIINYISLITKQFIFAQKCRKEPRTFARLLDRINNIKKLEIWNARFHKEHTKVYNRWCPFTGNTPIVNQPSTTNNIDNYVNEYIETHM